VPIYLAKAAVEGALVASVYKYIPVKLDVEPLKVIY
jgi:hypothetical protein